MICAPPPPPHPHLPSLPPLLPSHASPSPLSSSFPPSFPPFPLFLPLLSLCVGGGRAVPLLGAALQKPFREYLEAQKAKLHHHAGEGIPTVSTGASAPSSQPLFIHVCAPRKECGPLTFASFTPSPSTFFFVPVFSLSKPSFYISDPFSLMSIINSVFTLLYLCHSLLNYIFEINSIF